MHTSRSLLQFYKLILPVSSPKWIRLPLNHRSWASSSEAMLSSKEAFHNALPGVIKTITSNPKVAHIPNLESWLENMLQYNLTGGKGMRGQFLVMSYEMLEKPENITESSMKQAYTLGWCCEMFQSYLVMTDDIMDCSETRRGKPCWYKVPGVGISSALNDAILVYNSMFYVLRENFGTLPSYTKMLDTVNETMLHTSFGQFLDTNSSDPKDHSIFTKERYETIVKFKSGYYTFDMQIYLGVLLANHDIDEKTRKFLQDICLEIGVLFQIQDDYIDCYGNEKFTGKIGTDIREGKCSWLAVNALQRCSNAQRLVFKTCYGSSEPAHIERIKVLYDQLEIPSLYKQVEARYYDDIMDRIQKLPSDELKRLFHKVLGITYQRKK